MRHMYTVLENLPKNKAVDDVHEVWAGPPCSKLAQMARWKCPYKLTSWYELILVLGPSLIFGEPIRAELFFRNGKSSWAELFAFKTEPNRAFGFPKLSYFWLFWVDFFKEYNFLVEKTHFYWCLQDCTLRNCQKC